MKLGGFDQIDILTFSGRIKIDPATGIQVGHEIVTQ